MNGVNGELKLIIKDLPVGDPSQRGIDLQGRLHLISRSDSSSNSGFARPRQSGWTDIPERPFLGQASGRPRHHAA